MSKPGKVLRNLCKKLGVRLTVKRGKKRVYKSIAVLKRQCANKKKKKVKRKVKRKRRFGTIRVIEQKKTNDTLNALQKLHGATNREDTNGIMINHNLPNGFWTQYFIPIYFTHLKRNTIALRNTPINTIVCFKNLLYTNRNDNEVKYFRKTSNGLFNIQNREEINGFRKMTHKLWNGKTYTKVIKKPKPGSSSSSSSIYNPKIVRFTSGRRERIRKRKLEQDAVKGLLDLNKRKRHWSGWKYFPREGDVEIMYDSDLGIDIDWDDKYNIYVSGYNDNATPEIKNKIKKGMFITKLNDIKAPVRKIDGKGAFIRMLNREKNKGPVKITFSRFPWKIDDPFKVELKSDPIRDAIIDLFSNEPIPSGNNPIIDLSNEPIPSGNFDFSVPEPFPLKYKQSISRPFTRKQRLTAQRKEWYNRVCSHCLMPHGRCTCKQFGRKRKKVKKKRKVKRKRKKMKRRK